MIVLNKLGDSSFLIIYSLIHPKLNLLISQLNHVFSLLFDSTIIEPSEYVTSLGVTLDSKLSFSRFISSICKSANYNLYNIRKIRKYLTVTSTMTLVQSLITYLDYVIVIALL